jgi:hypothetical protein
MTETQRKWLLKYIDKEWLHTDFTYAQDKQDLLEAVIKKEQSIYHVFSSWSLDTGMDDFVVWLIKLSPLETAELICKWNGVE